MSNKKTVYTNSNIKKLIIDKGIKEFVLDDKVILTPSAADILREHGVRLVSARSSSSDAGVTT